MALYKTTIVIWSEFDGETVEIRQLAQEAMDGSCYCSKQKSVKVEKKDLENDPDWDGTDFFLSPEEVEER